MIIVQYYFFKHFFFLSAGLGYLLHRQNWEAINLGRKMNYDIFFHRFSLSLHNNSWPSAWRMRILFRQSSQKLRALTLAEKSMKCRIIFQTFSLFVSTTGHGHLLDGVPFVLSSRVANLANSADGTGDDYDLQMISRQLDNANAILNGGKYDFRQEKNVIEQDISSTLKRLHTWTKKKMR